MSGSSFNTNIPALRASRQLSLTTQSLRQSYERLSTGLRINRASDDAAGLAIADRLRVDARLYNQARRNVNDGLSMINIVDSTLEQQTNILVRLQELAEQSQNGTLSNAQRRSLNVEYQALVTESNRLASTSTFNGLKPLLGTRNGASGNISLQAGINGDANSTLSITSADTGSLSGYMNLTNMFVDADGTLDGFDLLSYQNALADGTITGLVAALPNTFFKTVTDNRGLTRTLALSAFDSESGALGFFVSEVNLATGSATIVTNAGGSLVFNIEARFVNNDPTTGRLQNMYSTITFQDGAQSVADFDFSALRITGSIPGITFGSDPSIQSTNIDATGVETVTRANAALSIVERRAADLSNIRGTFGALSSRLLTSYATLATSQENVTAAESQIRDVDISSESAYLVASQIRQQAAAAVLAQANQGPSLLLSLLNAN